MSSEKPTAGKGAAAKTGSSAAAPPPPREQETPGQTTLTREDFDAMIDTKGIVAALARQINSVLDRLPAKPTISKDDRSGTLERVHEEGHFEVSVSGSVEHWPLTTAAVEAVLSQVLAHVPAR